MLFNKKRISYIIPVYNTELYIDSCLHSILKSEAPDLEVICINDGSTDGTEGRLKEWLERDRRIKVLSQDNKGVSFARNRGLREAHGEYVLFLDSDDMAEEPSVFERICDLMDKEKLDIVAGGAKTVYESKELALKFPEFAERYRIQHDYPSVMEGVTAIREMREKGDWMVVPGLKVYRRSFLQKYRLSFLEGHIHEDGLFTWEALCLAHAVRILQQPLFVRRIRDNSIMTKPLSHSNTLGYLAVLIQGLRFLEKYNNRIAIDKTVGRSIAVFKEMAIKTYNQLSDEEKKELMSAMTDEQTFYFETFIKVEAALKKKLNQ